jgi:hypothetical protein
MLPFFDPRAGTGNGRQNVSALRGFDSRRPLLDCTSSVVTQALKSLFQRPTCRFVDPGGPVEALFGLGALFSLFFIMAFFVFTVGGFALWVWAFFDAIKKDDWMFASGSRMLWAIVIGLGGPLGAVVYLAVGRVRPARA